MKKELFKIRGGKVRDLFDKHRIDALLIIDQANVRWVSGFSGHDSWVLLTRVQSILITDSRYTEAAYMEAPHCRIIERKSTLQAEVGRILKRMKSVKVLGVENSASVTEFKAVKKALDRKVKTTNGIVEELRSIKDESEISSIRRAGAIAANALASAMNQIEEKMTEFHLAGLLDFEIRKLGSKNGFDTIVAFGANASKPHHVPTNRKLRKNDTILIDFGAVYNGYCSDITRCFTVGSASELYKKVYDTVKEAQAAAIEAIGPGVEIAKVDAAARRVISQAGLAGYGHGTGHGLGLEVHELPVVSARSKDRFAAGQVITIEPGVYIQKKLGVRIEDDVLVTKSGREVLTQGC